MFHTTTLARSLTLALALAAGAGLAQAKSVPGDGAIPVVELMPLTLRYEADLKLSAEQIQALDSYRKQAMPGRVAVQKKSWNCAASSAWPCWTTNRRLNARP